MKAWQLIEDPQHWTTKVNARTIGNISVGPRHSEACKWCAIGAIWNIYDADTALNLCHKVTAHCVSKYDKLHLSQVNDQLGHDVVLSVLKELDV